VQNCELCGACVEACPTGARQIIGTWMSVDAVLRTVLKDRLFYEDSGGGVTFSGGEPLMQADFLLEVLKACRGQGIHTAVDTCGYAPREDVLSMAPFSDLFLYDLKFMDEAAHLKFTGCSNKLILDNLRALADVHKTIWVRVPLIPGANDSPEELLAIAEFASSLPGIRRVNILPYHANGTLKAARLGQTVRLPATQPPEPDKLQKAVEIFRRAGLPVQSGG
jgi:pyruvate formate lyase activating enzyme